VSRLPFPERVLGQHIATLGKTGSGKSSAMRVIAEHLLDRKKRVCIIDPKGDWWGLKSSADGKSAGYPVIMFGDFKEPRATDVPINDRSGKHVAELIATGNRPCVLGFRGWMPAQLVRFWLDFAPALFNANEGELYVIIDEVHNFAPKGKIFDPDAGKCLHWTNRIMSEGRGLGLTFFIASQRPQKVHNDTLDNCETLIAMRVAHPAARQALKDWIDGNGDPKRGTEVLNTLAQLKRGEAWIWSPENDFGPSRVQFPMFQTFDSFAPPQLQKKVSQAGWSEVDLDQVKEKLAIVIAESKANDPKELKAEIQRLRQELAKKQPASAKSVTVVDEKVISRAVNAATAPLVRQLETLRRQARQAIDGLAKATAPLNSMVDFVIDNPPPTPIASLPAPARLVPQSRLKSLPAPSNGDQSITAAEVRVLSRLVELMECTGKKDLRKEQLAAWSKYSPTSSTWTNYLGSLRSAGMIDYPSPGFVSITDEGRALAQPENVPTSSSEMLSRAKHVLGGGEAKLLEILHASRDAISKSDLAEASDYSATSSTFTNYLGRTRTLGFVTYPSPGQVKCADWLYLNGDAA
jgi:uncharacterized protein